MRDVGEIEPAVAAFARSSNGGFIVTIGTLTDAHRDMISTLATRYRLPAVYPFPFFVRSGGLISYWTDITGKSRRIGQFGAIQGAGSSFRVEIKAIGVDDAEEIERGLTGFVREPNGGLIVLAQATPVIHRNLIIKLTAQHRLPAVYGSRFWAAEGGLVSYGPDILDQYRLAAGYV